MIKYDVYALGNAIVDNECSVSDDVIEKLSATKGMATLIDSQQLQAALSVLENDNQAELKQRCGGGSAANTLVAVQQLGGKTAFACSIADDEAGQFYQQDLMQSGIALEKCIVQSNMPSGQCLVMVSKDGERTMLTHLGAAQVLTEEAVCETSIVHSRYLYIEGYMAGSEYAAEAIEKAIKTARSGSTQVALTFSDPSIAKFCREPLKRFLEQGVDILFCNEQEALIFTEQETLESAVVELQRYSSHLVITLGEKGVLIYSGEQQYFIATDSIKPLDTTGAGDSFAGAYLFGLCQGMSIEWSAKLANKTALALIQRFGSRLDKDTQQNVLMEFM